MSHLTFMPRLVYAFMYLPYGLLVFGFSLHVQYLAMDISCSLFSFYGLYSHLLWLIVLFGLPTTRLYKLELSWVELICDDQWATAMTRDPYTELLIHIPLDSFSLQKFGLHRASDKNEHTNIMATGLYSMAVWMPRYTTHLQLVASVACRCAISDMLLLIYYVSG